MPYKVEFLAMTRHDPQNHCGRLATAKVNRLALGIAVLKPGENKVLCDALYDRLRGQIDRYVAGGVARVTRLYQQAGVPGSGVITQNIPASAPSVPPKEEDQGTDESAVNESAVNESAAGDTPVTEDPPVVEDSVVEDPGVEEPPSEVVAAPVVAVEAPVEVVEAPAEAAQVESVSRIKRRVPLK